MTTVLSLSNEALEVRYITITSGVFGAAKRMSGWDEGAVYTPKFLVLEWQSRDGEPWTLEDVCLGENAGECTEWGAEVEALSWVAGAITSLWPYDKAPE